MPAPRRSRRRRRRQKLPLLQAQRARRAAGRAGAPEWPRGVRERCAAALQECRRGLGARCGQPRMNRCKPYMKSVQALFETWPRADCTSHSVESQRPPQAAPGRHRPNQAATRPRAARSPPGAAQISQIFFALRAGPNFGKKFTKLSAAPSEEPSVGALQPMRWLRDL